MMSLVASQIFTPLERIKVLFLPLKISPHIFLDGLSCGQAESYFKTVQDNRIYFRQYLSWVDSCLTQEGTLSLIEGMLEEEKIGVALRLTFLADNQAIGGLWLYSIDWEDRSCKLGYWIAPAYQKKGVVTLTCQKILPLLYQEMGLHLIIIECGLENKRSRLIPQKLGFLKTQVIKNNEWLYDHFIDHVQYIYCFEQ